MIGIRITVHISNRRERARGPDVFGERAAVLELPTGGSLHEWLLPASPSGRLVVAISGFRLLQRWVTMEVTVSSTQSVTRCAPRSSSSSTSVSSAMRYASLSEELELES